jgi:hypothetical protein
MDPTNDDNIYGREADMSATESSLFGSGSCVSSWRHPCRSRSRRMAGLFAAWPKYNPTSHLQQNVNFNLFEKDEEDRNLGSVQECAVKIKSNQIRIFAIQTTARIGDRHQCLRFRSLSGSIDASQCGKNLNCVRNAQPRFSRYCAAIVLHLRGWSYHTPDTCSKHPSN